MTCWRDRAFLQSVLRSLAQLIDSATATRKSFFCLPYRAPTREVSDFQVCPTDPAATSSI